MPICSVSTSPKDQSPTREKIMNSLNCCARQASPKTNSTSTKSELSSAKNQLSSLEWWTKPKEKKQELLLSLEVQLLTMVEGGYGLVPKLNSNSLKPRMNSLKGMKWLWLLTGKMGKLNGRSMRRMQELLNTQCSQKTTKNGFPISSSRKKMIPFSGWIDPYLL